MNGAGGKTHQAPLGVPCVALLKERIQPGETRVTINIPPLMGLYPCRLVVV